MGAWCSGDRPFDVACIPVGRIASSSTYAAVESVSLERIRRREPDDSVAVCSARRKSVLSPSESHPGAGLFCSRSGRGVVTLRVAHVHLVTLGGWLDGAPWRKASPGDWPGDRGMRVCVIRRSPHRWQLLGHVFPGGGGAGLWHDGNRRAADYDGNGGGATQRRGY